MEIQGAETQEAADGQPAGRSEGWPEQAAGDERYHPCPAGRHWGPRGAAGILPWTVTPDGRTWVLLSHRSPHVQAGGTWSTFGGAIDDGETPWHAAIRETSEEIEGIDVRSDDVAAELKVPCEQGCGWSYTTFAVRIWNTGTDYLPSARVAPGRSAWETAGLAWMPADEVAAHSGLHPGLSTAWPELHRAIRGSRPPNRPPASGQAGRGCGQGR
jgi:8-oxo-dGTP pyrophosphatase MutT (NUDIX family)